MSAGRTLAHIYNDNWEDRNQFRTSSSTLLCDDSEEDVEPSDDNEDEEE